MSKPSSINRPIRKHDADGARSYDYSYAYGDYGYAYAKERRPRQLNGRLLVASLILMGAGGTGVYFWHQHQLQKLSVTLLSHAEELEQKESWREAADAFYRYWKITKDPEILGRIALTYDKASGGYDRPGVISSYQRAVGQLPDRIDLRTRLAELLVREGQYSLGREQAEEVLRRQADNSDATKWRAMAIAELRRKGDAIPADDVLADLERALEQRPGDFDLARQFTLLVRVDLEATSETELAQRADAVMDRLVAADIRNPFNYLARHQYRTQFDLPGRQDDINRALLLAPKHPLVVEQAAWDAHRDNDFLTARELFKQLIEIAPKNVQGYIGSGDAEFFSGSPKAAIRAWQLGREQAGATLPLLTRLADVQIQLDLLAEAEVTLNDIDEHCKELVERGHDREQNWAVASSAYFRALWFLAKGDQQSAIPKLKLASTLGRDITAHTRRGANTIAVAAYLRLGATYRTLGAWEDAVVSYERALKLKPNDASVLLSTAEAWSAIGHPGRAADSVRIALKQPQASKQCLLRLAEFLFQRQIQLPHGKRDWSEFEVAFETARGQLTDSWELRLLEVDYEQRKVVGGSPSRAFGLMYSLEQDFPDQEEVWFRLPVLYELMGQPQETERALKRLDSLTSSDYRSQILLADILLGRGDMDTAERVLQGVETNRLNRIQRWDFEQAKLRVVLARGDASQIDAHLLTLDDAFPEQDQMLHRLLDRRLAGVSATSQPTTVVLLERLRDRQGLVGQTWNYYACRLAMAEKVPDLGTIQNHLTALQNARPYWSRTQELAGRVASIREDRRPQDVRNAYEDAVTWRDANPELIQLLFRQYVGENDYLSLWQRLDQWQQEPPIVHAVEAGHWLSIDRRIQRRIQPTVSGPNSSVVSLAWELLEATDAERAALVADHVERNPDDVSSPMFQWRNAFLAGSAEQQRDALQRVRELAKVPDLANYLTGQALQYSERLDEALEQYSRIDPNADYRLQSEINSGEANRFLVASRVPLPSVVRLAPPRLDATRGGVRMEAIIRLRRGGRSDLEKAKNLLQQLTSSEPVEANDRLLLGKCLEELGDISGADRQLSAVAQESPTAQHLATLVDFLLRQGATDRAEVWIDQLEDQSGANHDTVGLRARWMSSIGREAEVEELVDGYAQLRMASLSEEQIPEHVLGIAKIYRDVAMTSQAERWLQLLAERFPAYPTPINFLLLKDDVTEAAIQRCLDQLESNPTVEKSVLLARILVYGNVSSQTWKRAEPLLAESLERYGENGSFLFAMGNLKLKQGDVDEAIRLLEIVTEVQPTHYLAWNNLAALLAEQEGRQDEAMEKIDQAIQHAAYEVPTLLDTKAVVLMHAGRLEDAAALLDESVTKSRAASDPRFYFHLAIIRDKLNDTNAAAESLRDADDLGLEKAFLTKQELADLRQLRSKLPQ